jgi:ribosomal protein S18 acetylase RimI-like enzyme
MKVRVAHESEVGELANIWHEGWQDAHATILPPELAKHRTLESFRSRLLSNLENVRVAGPVGRPLGLCIIKGDELYQLYVSSAARGTGIADALLTDAEKRLEDLGVGTAWLACAIGNKRAARFYEKNGWTFAGTMVNELPTPEGRFPLEVWRYEKALHHAPDRPAVGVAHVVLQTDRMGESCRFMRIVGMRPIFEGPEVSVFELRGGTHLILMRKDAVGVGSEAAFDLMVDDLHRTHERFESLGLAPSPIEARPAIDHEIFTVREPSGHVITFFSSHASGKPT